MRLIFQKPETGLLYKIDSAAPELTRRALEARGWVVISAKKI